MKPVIRIPVLVILFFLSLSPLRAGATRELVLLHTNDHRRTRLSFRLLFVLRDLMPRSPLAWELHGGEVHSCNNIF